MLKCRVVRSSLQREVVRMATSRSFHRNQRLHMRRWAAIAAAALTLSTLLAFFGSRVVSAVGDLTVRVYTDTNRNGQYDSEPGVSGVPVSVYNTDNNLLFSVNTNASGLAIFPNTPNGDYRVEVTNPGNGAPNGTVISLPGSTTPGQDNALVFFVKINNAPVQRDVGLRSLDASGVDTGAPAGYRTIVVRAWDDRDANGIQDAGEPELPGLTLGLFDNFFNTQVATATTGPDGTYRFVDNVPANVSNYTIRVTGGVPAGWVLTTPNANLDSEDRRDSDAQLVAGEPRITVPNRPRGVNDDSLDVGFSRGAVSGFVWRDLDQNGLRDPGEPFINGVTVELRDSSNNLIGTQTTRSILNDPANRAGFFEFTSVPLTVTYRVRIPNAEFDQSTDLLFGHATPQTQTVSLPQIGNQGLRNGTDPGPVVIGTGDFLQTPDFTLNATNRRNETSNFGLYAGTVGDFVWHDVNRNGIFDPLETTLGLANALVFVDLDSDCLIDTNELTTTTDLTGYYRFDSLPLGYTYTVVLDASNFAPGGALEGLGYTTGAACGSNEGVFITMTTALTATAPSFLNADFGIARAEIGNFVWEDNNGDGIFNLSETGVPSVTVQLYGAGPDGFFFTADDVTVGVSQTTNASGIYTITDILSGTYYATFDLSALPPNYVASVYAPTGWLSVDPLAQSSDDVNDVRAFVSGRVWRTPTFTITRGSQNPGVDAAVFRPVPITGAVRFDRDADNDLFADNEPGMQGVTVTLWLSNSVVLTTTTDATGAYTFTNVTPAISYTVRVTNPDTLNFLLVTPAGGDNDMATTDGGNTYAETAPFTVTSGATISGLSDAAVRGRATVTGQVWEDLNGNGQRETGEDASNLPNVPVTLTVNVNLPGLLSTTITTSTTTSSGVYTFTALPGCVTGTNQVSFTLGFATPSGWFDTPADVGAQATDSDGSGTGADQLNDQELQVGLTQSRDRGYYRPAVIQVRVFEEVTLPVDNQYASGDLPLTATITLTPNVVLSGPSAQDATGIITYTVAPTTTDYVIGVTTPAGYSPSPGNTGTLTVTAPLTSNTTYGPLAFGYFQAGTVTGTVRFDRDADNDLFADNEPGMQGVTVTLRLGGSDVLTTTTDATGAYTFTTVPPANNYSVRVINPDPTNFLLVTPAAGDNDLQTPVGDDADTATFNVAPGATVSGSSDAAVRGRATVTGQVWEDDNGNGVRDTGENVGALPVVTVNLTVTVALPGRLNTTVLASAVTDASGVYTFTNLPGGASAAEANFTLRFATPSGWFDTLADVGAPTTDSDGIGTGTDQLDDQALGRGATETRDRGYYRPAVIQVRVFEENPPVDNVYAAGDAPLSATITLTPDVVLSGPSAQDATGIITYTVAPTTTAYVIGVTTPSGYTPSPGNTGTLTVTAPLTSNTTFGPLEFGYFQAGTVTGAVRFDRDGDNVLFADTEPGMQGVTVTLRLGGSDVLTTTTDATGAYTFTGVLPANGYQVRVINPDSTNFLLVTPAGGDNDLQTPVGDDADTAAFNVAPGATVSGLSDAAVRGRATVTGQVWEDLNGNGQRETGEDASNLPNVPVTLTVNVNLPGLLSTTITTNTTTNASGFYTFTALPGWANASTEVSFTLGFATPSGWYDTLTDVGASATDSDGSGTGADQLDDQGLQRNTTATRDRGYYRPAVIQVRVFEEVTLPVDNQYASGDLPLTATITLTPNVVLSGPSAQDATGIITYTVAPTTTDYVIGVTTPAGYSPSPGNTGTLTVTAPLTSNTTYGPLDFGYFQAGTVTGAVRFDRDGDNILFTDNEPGMQGVTVTLWLSNSVVLTTTTDATGAYTFTNVTPAISYTVRVTNPDTLNFELVTPAGGDNDMATTDGGNTYAETAPFSVTAGATVGGLSDAAVRGRATVTGQVWEDDNGNGQRETGEDASNLPNVPVTLTVNVNLPGLLSTTITTNTTTNASGFYTFTALPGWANASTEVSFTLGFATPSGWYDTLTDVLTQTTDSDGSGTGPDQLDDQGLQRNTTATRDRGYYRPAVIQVRVFEENPLIDNVYAAGDVPLSATITLTPNVTLGGPFGPDATGIITYTVAPTTTDYVIGVTTPAGYTPSPGNTGTLTVTAPLTSNTTYGPFEFGYFQAGTVTGAVRFDRDGDNVLFADNEPGMQGVTVTLWLSNSVVLNTTTDATGAYTFTNVTPAISYTVRVTNPDTLNFLLVTPAGGDNDMATTDGGNTYAETAPFTVTSGAAISRTAAVRGRATVTGQVWEDDNGNGQRETGEDASNLPNVPVTLTVTVNLPGLLSTTITTSTVTSGGFYTFTALPGGASAAEANFTLRFATPSGWFDTLTDVAAGAPNNDSDGIGTGGDQLDDQALGRGAIESRDRGYYRPAIIQVRVFEEVTLPVDNQYASGDLPLTATITLTPNVVLSGPSAQDATGIITYTVAPTTTDYVIGVTTPAGYSPSPGNTGTLTVTAPLTSNTTYGPLAFGYFRPGTVTGTVRFDRDGDNILFADNEPGMQGVTVTLRLGGSDVLTTTTDATGAYTFTTVTPANNYSVRVINPDPTNFLLVTPAGGDNDMATTDIGNTYAETAAFSVTSGATVAG
jgi:hypothetical protein